MVCAALFETFVDGGTSPCTGQDGRDHLELFRVLEEVLGERDTLVLELCTVPGHEADLRQGPLEPDLFGRLGEFTVVRGGPSRRRRDFRCYESSRDGRDPESEREGSSSRSVGHSICSSLGKGRRWIQDWSSSNPRSLDKWGQSRVSRNSGEIRRHSTRSLACLARGYL